MSPTGEGPLAGTRGAGRGHGGGGGGGGGGVEGNVKHIAQFTNYVVRPNTCR